jgi:hypothetical protein
MSKKIAAALVLLAGMFVVFGCFGAWVIKQLDTEYSALVQQSVDDLARVHDIVIHASRGYRSVAEMAVAPDPAQRRKLLEQLRDERNANDRIYDELRRQGVDRQYGPALNAMVADRMAFRHAVDGYVSTLDGDSQPAAANAAALQVVLALVQYEQSTDKLADEIQTAAVSRSKELTAEVRGFRRLLIGLSVAPLIIGLFVSFVVVYVILKTPFELELSERKPSLDIL